MKKFIISVLVVVFAVGNIAAAPAAITDKLQFSNLTVWLQNGQLMGKFLATNITGNRFPNAKRDISILVQDLRGVTVGKTTVEIFRLAPNETVKKFFAVSGLPYCQWYTVTVEKSLKAGLYYYCNSQQPTYYPPYWAPYPKCNYNGKWVLICQPPKNPVCWYTDGGYKCGKYPRPNKVFCNPLCPPGWKP